MTSIVSWLYAMTALFSLGDGGELNRAPDTRGCREKYEGLKLLERSVISWKGTGKYELTGFLFPSFIDSRSDNILSRNYHPRIKYVYSLLIHCEITASLYTSSSVLFIINVFSFLNVTQFRRPVLAYLGQHDVTVFTL